MYSVGVIAYELCSNALPFHGPDLPDFREQHLHQNPPPLSNVSLALVAFVSECLFKARESRPSPSNALARLHKIERAVTSPGLRKLEQANVREVQRRADNGRRESEGQSEAERRSALFDAAFSSFVDI